MKIHFNFNCYYVLLANRVKIIKNYYTSSIFFSHIKKIQNTQLTVILVIPICNDERMRIYFHKRFLNTIVVVCIKYN